MPKFPITGDTGTDFILAAMLVLAGVAIALKAERSWGWLLVALAGAWAFFIMKAKGFI